MNRYVRLLAVVGAVALVAAACRPGDQPGVTPDGELQRGGTMRVQMLSDVDDAFDPQKEYYQVSWGFYRCCLLRTLLSYNGKSAEEGGNDLHPDLAQEMPDVSDDGLTYTFRLKDGVTYAPPFQDREIVADDFINAMERTANPDVGAGYRFYYSVIEGFDEFSEGEADSISGMRAIDDKTLEVTLTREAGDFPFRMAMPAAAPIPRGAEEGHEDDYGRFLVSSGPYMFEGSENLDFDAAPQQQEPVAGYDPGRSIVLVRNPAWANDDLRPAFIDRFEVQIGGTDEDMFNKIDAGELDLHLDGVPPPQIIQAYQADPDKQARLHSNSSDGVRYISMNIAAPPFDDIEVRRAVNLAIDKDGLRRARGGELFGVLAGHVITDSLLNDVLADYDPYATENGLGDPDAAREAMARSEYDTDNDGVCDAAACKDVLAVQDEAEPYPQQTAIIQENLEAIGITLDVRTGERTSFMYQRCNDPAAQIPLCMGPGWGKDYSDATTFGEPLFGSSALGPDSCCNYSLVGASPEQLEEWGYEVREVPNVDDQIAACDALPIGDERIQCWAEVDRTLMEDVVPWVPWIFDNDIFINGERVQNYTYDQFSGQPALDHMALAGAGQGAES